MAQGASALSQTTRGGRCGLIGVNAGKRNSCADVSPEDLTGSDSRMKARLKALPDKLRGGAWPSPVRAVRCPVNSGNGRDPYLQLPADAMRAGHSEGTAQETGRKDGATADGVTKVVHRLPHTSRCQYAPNLPGRTRRSMVGTMGFDPERGR